MLATVQAEDSALCEVRLLPRFVLIAAILCSAGLCSAGLLRADDRAGLDFFEQRIRPVLVKHCYSCHSAKSRPLRGGLRLDSKQGWQLGGDSGPALVPGKPEKSLLLAAIKYQGFEMPPKQRLDARIVADFDKWIRMGAPDPRHAKVTGPRKVDIEAGRSYWAFRAPRRPALPNVSNDLWRNTAIDRFVFRRLEQAGLQPAAVAERRMLVRRLYFDLIGLPPTVEQVHDFVNDRHPMAYERLVESLLATSQFGEKWGRHWLDVARYADSNGGDINLTFYNAWRYRDYVIRAFNKDKPYDQFVREQIGGDLLPAADDRQRREQMVATGFLLVGPKMLSERDKERLYLDVADEQIDSTGRAFLGLTLGCARCHDHKFDPIATEDYYRLAGIFRSTETVFGIRMGNVNVSGWLERVLPMSPTKVVALKRHEEQVKRVNDALSNAKKELAALKKKAGASLLRGIVVDDTEAQIVGRWKKSTSSPHYFGAGYIHDERDGKGKKSVTYRPLLPKAGKYEVRLAYAGSKGRDRKIPVTVHHVGGVTKLHVDQQPLGPIGNLWKSLGEFQFKKGKQGSVIISTEGTTQFVIADAMQFIPLDESTKAKAADQKVVGLRKQVAAADARVKKLQNEVKALTKKGPAVPMAMAVRDHKKTQDMPVHIRGETRNLGKQVARGFPQVLAYSSQPKVNGTQSGRLELAEWIGHARNPLTARVMVNRLWHHLFGQGLVRTVDNFGARGTGPSHPLLLDYLTMQYVDSGWSTKRLIREIVLSRTYRLTCRVDNPSAEKRDPDNRLLWRQNRRRLPVESFRDAILSISDQLDYTAGGSAVSEMPESAISNGQKQAGGGTYAAWRRRAVYMPIVRNDLPHVFTAFDFSDPDVVSGARPQTTVPDQALWLLNSDFVREAAARVAKRLLTVDDERRRIVQMFELILSREPTPAEFNDVRDFVAKSLAQRPMDNEQTRAQQAWSEICQVMLASTNLRFLE